MKKITILALMLITAFFCSSCANNVGKLNLDDIISSSNIPNNSSTVSTESQKSTVGVPSNESNKEMPKDITGNLSELQNKGFKTIEEQSFWVGFENWGKVRFVSGTYPDGGTYKLHFYLVDDSQNVLYDFPEFYGNQWSTFFEFQAVAFRDVNNDGLKDIIIIADYMTGVGPTGAIPFHVASIYYQKDKDFMSVLDLDNKINDEGKNENIDMVLKFAKGKEIDLSNEAVKK